MHRRHFLQTAGAGAIVASSAPLKPALAESNDLLLASAPVLINPGSRSITVLCAVNDHAAGWVEYGPDESLGQRAEGTDQGMHPYSDRLLRFNIDGLEPGRAYSYRVHVQPVIFHSAYNIERGEEIVTETRSFRTLDPNAGSACFVCWNDTHENDETLARLTRMLREDAPDFMLWNGDVTNDIHREEQIVGQFLRPGGQAFADTIPHFLGRGNHDVRGRDARLLTQYINGPEDRYYFAFRQGPLACVVLDTGEDKPDDLPVYAGLNAFDDFRTEQMHWLASVIQQEWFRSAPFRVVFTHIPMVWDDEVPEHWPGVWGDGIKGWICEDGRKKWEPLFIEGRVDAVISGHTHRHAWFPANAERPYGQLIGGGPQPDRAVAIVGRADANRFELIMKNLDGETLMEHVFEA